LKELRKAGYLNRTQGRQGNRQASVIYTLYEDKKLFQQILFEEAQTEQILFEEAQKAPLQIKNQEQTKETTQTKEEREGMARAPEIESEQFKIFKRYYPNFKGELLPYQQELLARMVDLKDCESALAHAAGNGIRETSIAKIVNEVFANREWEAKQNARKQGGNGSTSKPGKYGHLGK
jgi:hypothetical protein